MWEKTRQSPLEEVRAALDSGDVAALRRSLEQRGPRDLAHDISRLRNEEISRLLDMLPHAVAADLMESLPEVQAAQIARRLDPERAAEILNEMESDEQADLINQLSEADADDVLRRMEPEEASDARRLMQYPAESAGGLMLTEYLAYVDNLRVEDVISDLRRHAEKYREYEVQYAYVVSLDGKLVGVLRLRDLLLAASEDPIARWMIEKPLSVRADTKLEDLERFFEQHPLFGVPVVDDQGQLIGVVHRSDVEEAAEERSSRSFLKYMGILGGEEIRTMPLGPRTVRRLSWLSINIVLNVIAAGVIAVYQDTVSAVIALAVFLPIVSDMSGNSGSQAMAVSMRELALGMVRPTEWWRVFYKEAIVGVLNGLALGMLLCAVAVVWTGNLVLGLVVAAAMALNTVVAGVIGGTVPLLLRGLGHDPALASGPILTTITDMCGFFLLLFLASIAMPWLSGG